MFDLLMSLMFRGLATLGLMLVVCIVCCTVFT